MLVGITGGSRPAPKSKLIPHVKLNSVPNDIEMASLIEDIKRL